MTRSVPSNPRPTVSGITIDGATSRDLDDAIWTHPVPDGGYRVTISIADVAEAIGLGEGLDLMARSRVETRYLRNGNDPMLPRSLSEGALSLFDGQERKVLAITLTLAPDGTPGEATIHEALLVSLARFSHDLTDRVLQGGVHPLQEQLRLCQQVAQLLLQRRQASGACAFYDVRRGLYADEDGVIRPLQGSAHAQIIVQEFMILANERVATWMAKSGRTLLFRNHQARAAAPARAEVLRQINEVVLHPNLLSGLQDRLPLWFDRAVYGPSVLGHFALNIPAYTHFTSPIRRYVDLVNHRMVKAALNGEPAPYGSAELEAVATEINEWKAAQAQAASAHYKGTAIRERREALGTPLAVLEALDGPSFGRVLEQAAKDDCPVPELVQAMAGRDLTTMDLFFLLFRGGAGWLEARRTALVRLQKEPFKAISVLEIAKQKDQIIPACELLPSKSGFLALQRVTRAGKTLASPQSATASTKKEAQSLAAVAWLVAWTEGTLVPAEDVVLGGPKASIVQPSLLVATQDGPRNYLGVLHEWCQERKAKAPVFTFSVQGPPHQPCFKATATLAYGQDTLVGTGEPFASKQEAKRSAAQTLFLTLQERGVASEAKGAGLC